MKLSSKLINSAVATGLALIGLDDEYGDEIKAEIAKTVKLASDAEYHTGSKGCLGYFAIEGTMLMSYYYDAPVRFEQWREAVSQVLADKGFFLENKNHCELVIY